MSLSDHPTNPPPTDTNPSVPLTNLAAVRHRVDSLSRHLTDAVNSNTILPPHQMDSISSELISAVHQTIINGAALLQTQTQPDRNPVFPKPELPTIDLELKEESHTNSDDLEIVEIDAMELLAENIHVCEICGKGFKRDANLRMHMRAHGDKYKTTQALNKPKTSVESSDRKVRFSCPYVGCTRNKGHQGFRPLKSMICVKNHFKRSHCPKLYSCTRCHKKTFSVVADLRSHMKHCGEGNKCKCSCGTSFSRKDKLFAHISLFEGHMPAVDVATPVAVEEDVVSCSGFGSSSVFDELLEGFGSVDYQCLENMIMDSNPIDEEFFRL